MAFPPEMTPFHEKLLSLWYNWTSFNRDSSDIIVILDYWASSEADYFVGESYEKFATLLKVIMKMVSNFYVFKERLVHRLNALSESRKETFQILSTLLHKLSSLIDLAMREVISMNSYLVSFNFDKFIHHPFYSDTDNNSDTDDDDESYERECEAQRLADEWIFEKLSKLVEKLALSEEEKALCAPVIPLPAAKKVVSSETKECSNCAMVEGVTLRGCSRCRVVFYCGKVCQTQHWKQGGHKRYCVAVSERTVGSTQSAAATDNDCSICLEEMTLDSGVTSMSCGHALHARCLKDFSETFDKIIKCPVCRTTHRP